jgi:hypothetical protein
MTPRPDGFNVAADDPRGPNCGLTAIAIVTGRPYAEVLAIYKRLFKTRRGWRGGTTHMQRVELLYYLGVDHDAIVLKRRVKVRNFKAEPGKLYILRHAGHVCTLRDGWIADQRGPVPAAVYKYRECFVTHVLELTP